MPIDPSVLLYGLQPQARTPYDAPDVVAERRARVEQLREQAKAKQDAEYENQLYDWAVKSNLGPDGTPDFEGVRKSLAQVAPRYLQKFDAAMNTAKKSQAETYKLTDDHNEANAKYLANWATGIDQTNYGDRLNFLQQNRPDLAKTLQLPPTYDPAVVPTHLNTIVAAGTAVTEQNRKNEVIRKDAIEGNYDKAIARWIDAHPELQDDDTSNKKYENFLGQMQNLGAPQATIQPWRDKSFAELRASVPNVLTTPHERETEAEAQARLLQEARNAAAGIAEHAQTAEETHRHNLATEGAAQQRIDKPGAGGTAATAPVTIAPGTPDYKVAQDLAFGRMTSSFFRTLEAYNRDAGKKAALYAKAAEINPNFNQADFERGFRFAANPQTMRQLAALDNALSGIPSLLDASDAATRSGVTVLNKFTNPVKVAMGAQKFSNLKTARLAWADEVSGGLGFGTASDMKLQLGLDLTDENLSGANFRSAIQTVVQPFLERKRDTIYKQLGPYGTPQGNSSITAPGAKPTKTLPDGHVIEQQADGGWLVIK